VNKLRLPISLYPEYNLKISCFLAHHATSWTDKSRVKIRAAGSLKKIPGKPEPYPGFLVCF
jgi:hypothetical protein